MISESQLKKRTPNKPNDETETEIKNSKTSCQTTELKPKISTSSYGCMFVAKIGLLISLILTVLLSIYLARTEEVELTRYNDTLPNRPHHKIFYKKDFFSEKSFQFFNDLATDGRSFSTIVDENNVESAGEAVPVGHPNCRHPFMTLNVNRTLCHFPNRLDVGIHFVKTGGEFLLLFSK
jgi:hypothetical protein